MASQRKVCYGASFQPGAIGLPMEASRARFTNCVLPLNTVGTTNEIRTENIVAEQGATGVESLEKVAIEHCTVENFVEIQL